MRTGNPAWIGVGGNPNGRPVGARNLRTKEIVQQLIKDGHKDPLLRLSELVSNSKDESIAATASSMLAPYLHGKLGAIPASRYVETPIDVPNFQTISDVESFLARISQLVGRGELSIENGKDLAELAKAWVDAHYSRDELRIKVAQAQVGSAGDPIRYVLQGGLPRLPGTEVVMPGDPLPHEWGWTEHTYVAEGKANGVAHTDIPPTEPRFDNSECNSDPQEG